MAPIKLLEVVPVPQAVRRFGDPVLSRDPDGALLRAEALAFARSATAAGATRLAHDIEDSGVNPFAGLSEKDRQVALLAVDRLKADGSPEVAAALASLMVNLACAGDRPLSTRAWRALESYVDSLEDKRIGAAALGALYVRRKALPRRVREAVTARLNAATPAFPPYADWERNGVRRVAIALQCQDEFYPGWSSFLPTLGFERVSEGEGTQVFRRADLVDGKRTEFEVRLILSDDGMFRPMADPEVQIVAWCGHSDWWARVARDLRHAPAQSGNKVFLNFMCFGASFLKDILAKYPSAQVVTSRDPTEDVEDQAAFEHILKGISSGASWRDMAAAVRRDPRNPDHNFIFPSDLLNFIAMFDRDRDGRSDALDTLFDRLPRGDLTRPLLRSDFLPEEAPRQASDGLKVVESAILLNGVTYDHQLLDKVNGHQLVRAGGFFHPAPGDARVVELTEQLLAGRRVMQLRVSDRFAHAHPAALVGMVIFEGTLALLDRLQPPLEATDRVLAAMAVLAHVTDNDRYPYGAAVFRGVLQRYGLPELSRRRVLDAVEANPKWESGSWLTLKALRALALPAQLTAIASWARARL